MKCPIDGELLAIAERQGVEIDYCPKCRGVWLDRGELEKSIDRSGNTSEGMRSDAKHHGSRPHKKKRESILSELFDF